MPEGGKAFAIREACEGAGSPDYGMHSLKSTQLTTRIRTETSAVAGPQECNNHSTKKDNAV